MTTQESIPPSDHLLHDRAPLPRREWPRDRYADEHPLGPLRPIVRRWPLVLVVMLVCAAAGAAVGLKRSPTWSASSTVNVGRVDVRVQALPGYVAGAETLAAAYSRIADSQAIAGPAGRTLGMSPAHVASHVTATPVPGSPMFRIIGTGASQAQAIRITNVVTAEIKRYVTASNSGQDSVGSLLRRYERAVAASDRLRRTVTRLEAERSAAVGPTTTTAATAVTTTGAPSLVRIRSARVRYQTEQLRAQTLAAQYQSRAEEVASTAGVQVIATPLTATSNRKSKLERLVAVGLVGGLVAGSLLALLLEATRRRRSS
jgi:capsular polysaccharide biosynthesis protein